MFCYKKLWKLLIDNDLKKTDLKNLIGISSNTLAKLSKNEPVSMEILLKICTYFKCNIGDIVEISESVIYEEN